MTGDSISVSLRFHSINRETTNAGQDAVNLGLVTGKAHCTVTSQRAGFNYLGKIKPCKDSSAKIRQGWRQDHKNCAEDQCRH